MIHGLKQIIQFLRLRFSRYSLYNETKCITQQQYKSSTTPPPINTAGRPWDIHHICSSIGHQQHQYQSALLGDHGGIHIFCSSVGHQHQSTLLGDHGGIHHICSSIGHQHQSTLLGDHKGIHHICSSIGHQHQSTLLGDHGGIHHICSRIGHQHQSTLLGDHGDNHHIYSSIGHQQQSTLLGDHGESTIYAAVQVTNSTNTNQHCWETMGHLPYLQQYRSLTVPTAINTAGGPWGIHSIYSSIGH